MEGPNERMKKPFFRPPYFPEGYVSLLELASDGLMPAVPVSKTNRRTILRTIEDDPLRVAAVDEILKRRRKHDDSIDQRAA